MIVTDGIGINPNGSNPACSGMGKSIALDAVRSIIRIVISFVEHLKTFVEIKEP